MNIKAYIESGILESYVLGVLPANEAAEVEAMVQQYPEIAAELKQIEAALGTYATAHSKQPPVGLLDKINASIDESEGISKDDELIEDNGKIIAIDSAESKQEPPSQIWKYLCAASLLLLGASVAFNIWNYDALKHSQNEYAILEAEVTAKDSSMNVMQAKFENLEESNATLASNFDVVQDPRTQKVVLAATGIDEKAIATVYWIEEESSVYLNTGTLKQPDADMQFQLWALVDGQPIDAGVFDTDSSLIKLKDMPAADAFAVTLEPAGGSASPTLEQLYVLGEV